MFKASLLITVLGMLGWLTSFPALADISGVWKHAEKPALLNVDLVTGIASVKRHDNNKQAVGLTVIKDISKASDPEGQWVGQMYNGYENTYVAVNIVLADAATLLVYDNAGKEILKLVRQ